MPQMSEFPQLLAIFHKHLAERRASKLAAAHRLTIDEILLALEKLVELAADVAAEQAALCILLERLSEHQK
jgi:hypothetical protein